MKTKAIAATLVVGCAAPLALVAGAGVVGIGMFAGSVGSNDAICAGSSLSVSIDGELPASVGGYTPRAMEQAAIIMTVGEAEGISARGQLVALMTAMQESRLGDHPSTFTPDGNGDAGVFQQRQLPGWYGSLEEVSDTANAAKVFYKGKTLTEAIPGGAGPKGYHIPGLVNVEGWESLAPTVAAQRVQRSAHPQAYAKHEPVAREIMSALSGVDVSIDQDEAGSAVCGDGSFTATGDLAAVIERAHTTLGQRYVFGGGGWDGPTRGGQDCSGLTTYAYAAAGIRLPRTARAQWAALRSHAVSPSEAQPGDLIFESWGRLGADVSHVGIYLGDGKMIEASRGAAMTKISDARLSGGQFVGIARVPEGFTQ
ncbi:C40 family peptidase [Brachybacterium sp. J153]|uniref:C40 family peptidase n=1 Tax=Brachybacterium sp. J153 TaxID=3116488 RepID=UPI002E7A66DB|nr:C40 family peptidase [Brachybacterium sp. J153]MEE1616993.1 C40 family peptidase [Brachybacterium sp. J153]